MGNFIKIGCNKCNKFGIVPEKVHSLAISGINVPMVSTLSMLSKNCPFCDSKIVYSIVTEEEIHALYKEIEAGPAMDLFDLKKILHSGKI